MEPEWKIESDETLSLLCYHYNDIRSREVHLLLSNNNLAVNHNLTRVCVPYQEAVWEITENAKLRGIKYYYDKECTLDENCYSRKNERLRNKMIACRSLKVTMSKRKSLGVFKAYSCQRRIQIRQIQTVIVKLRARVNGFFWDCTVS